MKYFFWIFSIFLFGTASYSQCKNTAKVYTKYVNPFIGTLVTCHTFPGPCMPFVMVQPGPDNKDNGWDNTCGYQYKAILTLPKLKAALN